MKDESQDMKFGHYLEEFQVGHIYKHWPGKTITESDNNLFALITMNHHPLHIDTEYVRSTQHGQILVVGTLFQFNGGFDSTRHFRQSNCKS